MPVLIDEKSERKKIIDLFQRKRQIFIFRFSLAGAVLFLDIFFFEFLNKNLVLFSLSTVLIFFSLGLFKKGIFLFFKERKFNFDFIGASALISTFILCLCFTFFEIPQEKSFFSTLSLIVLLFSSAKFLEARKEKEVQKEIEKFQEVFPEKAKVIRQGNEVSIPLKNILLSDIVIVYPQEQIPVDGIVIEGHSIIDESLLTGQNLPQEKEFGNEVISGSKNLKGILKIKPIREAANSVLFEILRLVKKTKEKEIEIPRVLDRSAMYFFPVFLAFFLCAFILWKFSFEYSFLKSLEISLFVLILACPLGLLFSDLFPFIVISQSLLKEEILVKGRRALETLAGLNVIIFDKTKTLTFNRLEIDQIISLASLKYFYSEREILEIAACLEKGSQTPLAEVILTKAKSENIRWLEKSEVERKPGFGIEGKVLGKKAFLGGRRSAREKRIDLSPFEEKIRKLEEEGKIVLLLGVEDRLVGLLAISDFLRKDAPETVKELKEMKIEMLILTGDSFKTTETIAKKLKIERFLAEVLPQEKEAEVKRLQVEGKKVGVVGGGLNDALAMTQADIGFALGDGESIIKEIAKVILLKNNLLAIPFVINLSKKFWKKVKRNIFWSLFWNILGVIAIFIFSLFSPEITFPSLINLVIVLGIGSVFINSISN